MTNFLYSNVPPRLAGEVEKFKSKLKQCLLEQWQFYITPNYFPIMRK